MWVIGVLWDRLMRRTTRLAAAEVEECSGEDGNSCRTNGDSGDGAGGEAG